MTPIKGNTLSSPLSMANLPVAKGLKAGITCSGSITFRELLDKIRAIFNQPDHTVDVDELWTVLESYKSNPEDWCQFAHYDSNKYRRNLVDEDENYNIMLIGWGPGVKSCIHDHSGSHCFMKTLDGELVESRFAWPNASSEDRENDSREMKRLCDMKIERNQVAYINDKFGLHLMANPNAQKPAASLHVYIPPLRQCKAFDQRTGKAQECKLTFHSKRGKLIQEDDDSSGGANNKSKTRLIELS